MGSGKSEEFLEEKGWFEKRKMSVEDLVKYESDLRKDEFQRGKRLDADEIKHKQSLHSLGNGILLADQLLSRERIITQYSPDYKYTGDVDLKNWKTIKEIPKYDDGKPLIFACTHIGGNDIQRAFQVIGDHAYLMLGNPGILYKKLIYQALLMNGVIPLETFDREDRKIAYEWSLDLLRNGGNLLIFPEGAWNVSPNVIVMKLFTGTVRLARETGARIIPIACEQYDNTFYFNVGEGYTIDSDTTKSPEQLTAELRDKLATLKWDIIISQPVLKREDVPTVEEFQQEIVERCNYGYGFSLQDALNEAFHDKTITTAEEAFEHIKNIDFNRKNAFLLQNKDNLELALSCEIVMFHPILLQNNDDLILERSRG